MKQKRNKYLTGIGVMLVLAMFALVSCSQGVPVEDAQQMQEEIKSITSRLSDIESSLLELKQEEDLSPLPSEVDSSLDDLIQELRDIAVRLAEIEAKLDFPEPEVIDPQLGGTQPAATF